MAGGPIAPFSAYPVTAGKVFPMFYSGDGATTAFTEGLGVMASVDADATWQLMFLMPPVLPSGTGTLNLYALADAVTGAAKVNPTWGSIAVGEDPSSATLIAETTQTLTWSTNDDDEIQLLQVTLNADTLVAAEIVFMKLIFETTSWTLAVASVWVPFIVWI